MKKWTNTYYHLAGIAILIGVFSISIFIRKDDLKSDLGRFHEWITAHSLVTFEIWNENGGPSAFGFNPVYTYPNKAHFPRKPMGGVTDKNGLHYYVSYPPFAFIIGYYSTKLLGGPDLRNIRAVNLLIHFLCGLIIYLILAEVMSRNKSYCFNVAGVVGASVYFLSAGTLWAHGMLYFADMLEQLLLLCCIYLFARTLRKELKRPGGLLTLIFITFFLAAYTEWLGVFYAFIAGLTLLILYFVHKRRLFLLAFVIIGISSSLAVSLTLFQYSSIAGKDKLEKAWSDKYAERSGHVTDDPKNPFHLNDEKTFKMVRKGIDRQFAMAENLTGSVAIVLVLSLLYPVTRKKMKDLKLVILLFLPFLIVVFMHYYLFYNFNALHAFSAIKAGLVMSLFIALGSHLVLTAMPNIYFKLAYGIALPALFLFKCITETECYHEQFPISDLDMNRVNSAKKIGQLSDPEKVIFTNMPFHPDYLYYSKRDLFNARDTSDIKFFMNLWQYNDAQYFVHEGSQLRYYVNVVYDNNILKLTDTSYINY